MDDGANVADNNGFPKPEGASPAAKGTGCGCRRRRWRRIGLALALLLAAVAVAVWALRDRGPAGPPLILTMPGGEKYQFAGTTYGTRNVPPSLEAKLVSALPARLANWARKYVGSQISQYNSGQKFDPPNLFIWFQKVGTNVPVWPPGQNFDARLADEAGIEAGVVDYPQDIGSPGVSWRYASFSAIPRRSRMLQLNFYPDYVGAHSSGTVGSIRIPNPLYGNYPEWKPEPVPAVKKVGDLEVRLDYLMAVRRVGGESTINPDGSLGIPYNPGTKFDFSVRSSRGTNEMWVLQSAELSDATGNVVRDTWFQWSYNAFQGYARPQLTEWAAYSESVHGTLWPDEAAWRLKLEFKRASGFAPEEIVTFKDVPVLAMGTTNNTPISKNAGGIQIVLTKIVRKPDITVNALGMYGFASQVTAVLPGKPKGVALDFLGMKADAGQAEHYGSSKSDFSYTAYVKSIPANAKTMDFTFVVQKTRSVEFLVKPPKGE
jgi:hypothetical protein